MTITCLWMKTIKPGFRTMRAINAGQPKLLNEVWSCDKPVSVRILTLYYGPILFRFWTIFQYKFWLEGNLIFRGSDLPTLWIPPLIFGTPGVLFWGMIAAKETKYWGDTRQRRALWVIIGRSVPSFVFAVAFYDCCLGWFSYFTTAWRTEGFKPPQFYRQWKISRFLRDEADSVMFCVMKPWKR